MKIAIVLFSLLSTALLANENTNTDTPGKQRVRHHIEITPGSDRIGQRQNRYGDRELRPVRLWGDATAQGVSNHLVYMVTTGTADLSQIPIRDLGDRLLTEQEINILVREIAAGFMAGDFYRYVGITIRGIYRRAGEHRRAVDSAPGRRLPLAIRHENAEGHPALMHTLVVGIHPEQITRIEAELIRVLEATGQQGLNGNVGNLGRRERGTRGQVEVTPHSAVPRTEEGRDILQFEGSRLTPLPQEHLPAAWQNIVYLMTEPGVRIDLPIVYLDQQLINEEQMASLEDRIRAWFDGRTDFEVYVGLAGAGVHQDRTPQTRAHEHERAALEHPFRRLPLAIDRVNQEAGPVQMHVLVAGIHPEQIRWVESRLIRLFGGTTARGWNSNPGLSSPGVVRNLFGASSSS